MLQDLLSTVHIHSPGQEIPCFSEHRQFVSLAINVRPFALFGPILIRCSSLHSVSPAYRNAARHSTPSTQVFWIARGLPIGR